MVIRKFISNFFFLVRLNQNKYYLSYFIIILSFFFFSEIAFVLGFPQITRVFNINNFNSLISNFEINLFFFKITNIYIYSIVFFINFILKIFILKIIVNFSSKIILNLSVEYFNFYKKKISDFNQSIFDELRSNLTVRLEILYSHFLIPAFTLVFSVVAFLGCAIAIALVNWKLAILSIIVFLFLYLIFFYISKSYLKNNDLIIKESTFNLSNIIDNILKDYKGLKINNDLNFIEEKFNFYNYELKKSYGINHFLGQIPRYAIESIGFLIIIIFAFAVSSNYIPKTFFIFFTSFGLASIRILPLIQRIYAALTTIIGSVTTWTSIIENVRVSNKENIYKKPVLIKTYNKVKKISLIELNYKIIKNHKEINLFNKFNLNLEVGHIYLIIGSSGTGKTTLLDIIAGLRHVKNLKYYINDRVEQNINNKINIYYLTQDASIPNGSFLEWFDRSSINNKNKKSNIKKLFQNCELFEYIPTDFENWIITNNARNLSFGQRQRIFIARAIWKKSNVLILDEPTSGMDKKNEINFFNFIKEFTKNSIVVIATHSISNFKKDPNIKIIDINKN